MSSFISPLVLAGLPIGPVNRAPAKESKNADDSADSSDSEDDDTKKEDIKEDIKKVDDQTTLKNQTAASPSPTSSTTPLPGSPDAQSDPKNTENKPPEKPVVKPQAGVKRSLLDRLEAAVNSSIILSSDVKKFRETSPLRAQLDPLFSGTPLAAQGKNASDADIVNFLIDKKLIAQQFPKTDAEVEQEINSIQANNHLDRSALKEALGREGYKFLDYFELIRSSSETRDLIEREIRPKVSITDDDIKNYFYNHYAKSESTPQAYHIQILTVANDRSKAGTTAKQIAETALKKIHDGESFEEVAKLVSDDASASSGGDLGTLTEDQMSSIIRDQVKKLKVGEVSPLLGGGAAGRYFILKLVGVKTGDSERLVKMKEEIRSHLASIEYQHQIKLWLDRQRQTAFVHRAGESSVKEIPVKQ